MASSNIINVNIINNVCSINENNNVKKKVILLSSCINIIEKWKLWKKVEEEEESIINIERSIEEEIGWKWESMWKAIIVKVKESNEEESNGKSIIISNSSSSY